MLRGVYSSLIHQPLNLHIVISSLMLLFRLDVVLVKPAHDLLVLFLFFLECLFKHFVFGVRGVTQINLILPLSSVILLLLLIDFPLVSHLFEHLTSVCTL